jgi:hypothetical protein
LKKLEVRLSKITATPRSVGAKTTLINCSTPRPRTGWREAFRAAGASDQKQMLLDGIGPNAFDLEEWSGSRRSGLS